MTYFNTLLVLICLLLVSCKTETREQTTEAVEANTKVLVAEKTIQDNQLGIYPISHATMVLQTGNTHIYVDPTGGAIAFEAFPQPDIVLITDIHGDHFHIETLLALDVSKSVIIAPQAVVDRFPTSLLPKRILVLENGEMADVNGIVYKAIPMYNLREDALQFHEKGRGNGYLLTINNERIYISGDTEDIPEMRSLDNIDKAFICMNLPWTMTVDKAAEAVLEFKPKTVYPYHYRGKNGMSDVEKFKTLVHQGDETIEVIQLDWYK